MIAKINNGASLFGALAYNMNKVREGQAYTLMQNRMIENITDDKSRDMFLAMTSFEPYLAANQRTEKPIVHISLNPDPKDVLADEQYSRLAAEYMERMGFGEQPYIVFKHEDIERRHLHIVTVRVDENGRKISDSYEKRRSMNACRELEAKFGLQPAVRPNDETCVFELKPVDYRRDDIKRQISNTLRAVFENYRFQTFGELNALLSCFNIDGKQVKGERFGQVYNGIVYSATNEHGNTVGNPLKSSLFGKQFGHRALNAVFERHAATLKSHSFEHYKPIIASVMKDATSMENFAKKLKESGITVICRRNEAGRIYGMTFIDHSNKIVFNGSRLGKAFSANAFHHRFGESTGSEPLPAMQPQAVQQPTSRPMSKSEQKNTSDTDALKFQMFPTGSIIEAATDLPGLSGSGENPEEEALRRKMRKKKKKISNNQ